MAFAFFAFLLPRLLSGMQQWHLGLVWFGLQSHRSIYSCSLVLSVLSPETLRLGVKKFFYVFWFFVSWPYDGFCGDATRLTLLTPKHAKNSEVTIDDVRDCLDNMYKENEELELENDGLRIIYDELQVEKDELQDEKMELEDENGELHMQNFSLRMTNDDLKVQLKYQKRKLNARIERLQTLLRVAKENIDSSDPHLHDASRA